MDATTLAIYESGIAKRQTLRRGKRTIYVRYYDVPYDSSPPLPEAGDFLPGETSGACVTADGVTILPVADKVLAGMRIVVTAQYPVYEDKSSSGTFPLGVYFVEGEQASHSEGNTVTAQWRFEVPLASWAALSIPAIGSGTPAALGGVGAVVDVSINYDSVPGFVACTLVTGQRPFYFDKLTKVSCRTVTIRKKLTVATNGTTMLAGPVAGQEETQRYAVAGDDEIDETYTQITITSYVSSIPAGWQGTNFNKRNQAAVTIEGVTYGTGIVLYTGGASESVDIDESPTGTSAYRLTVVLLAGATAWPLTVDRYIETKKIVELKVVDGGVEVGDGRAVQWVRAAVKTDSPTIRAEFDMATALGALP